MRQHPATLAFGGSGRDSAVFTAIILAWHGTGRWHEVRHSLAGFLI
jgi:hypothetical protein